MQSYWDKLVEFHTSLTRATVQTISPESWHHIISQTLSASPSSDNIKCHISPGMCRHCHQMMALSAVTTMTLLAKTKRDGQMEEMYLQPLLHHDRLMCMVDLLQHHCQYLRYQSRKALTSVCSLPALTESSAQHVAELCVQAVLQRSREDAICSEPLQLLCCLLSARSGCGPRVPLSAFLLPYLPALYQHCCQSPCSHPMDLTSGAMSARDDAAIRECFRGTGAVQGIHMQTLSTSVAKRPFCDGSGDPPCKQTRTGQLMQQEKSQPASSILLEEETVKSNANEFGCEVQSEGNQHSDLNSAPCNISRKAVKQIPEEQKVYGHTEQKALSQNCSVLHFESDHFYSFADENVQTEQHTDTTHHELDNDDINASVHISHQTLMSHYVFLCLIQKLTKLCNSLEAGERVKQAQLLKSAVLIQLITDHTALFSGTHTQQTSDCSLVERKFLDVVDTFMDYVQLRTSKDIDCVYEETAIHFVRCMQAAECSWSFPCQSTLIGGQLNKLKGRRDLPSTDLLHRSENEREEELLEGKDDADCSPVPVLLLAVVLKSCAIIFKSEKDQTGMSEGVRACVTLLRSVHSHLHQVFGARPSAEDRTGGPPTCVNWLAQVCGEQDDRWTEALLCLLDIFICLQSLNAHSADVTMLMTVLDPHPLFVQLLELTHYNVSLLIDWLTSPETCFLAYLARYLRLMAADFTSFVLAVSRWNPSRGSGSSSVHKDTGRVKKERAETPQCDTGRQGATTELGSSGLSVIEHHTAGVERPRSSVDGDTVCDGSSCPIAFQDLSSESPDQTTGATGLDKARESSLGMALLSCYDADSSSDSAGDESCDEGSFAVAAAGSSRERAAPLEHQENDAVCISGKRGTGPEGEGRPNQSVSSDSFCSDVDDSDESNDSHVSVTDDMDEKDDETSVSGDSSLSQTDTKERTCRSSQPEQHNLLCPTQLSQETKFVEGRETTKEDCQAGCVDRVMHLLTEVRARLERLHRGGLLVYNPAPLLSLMRTCEQQYNSQYDV